MVGGVKFLSQTQTPNFYTLSNNYTLTHTQRARTRANPKYDNGYPSEDMKPPNLTLDNNCIIDLEQNRGDAPQIRRLIQMHCNKEIGLRVVAISASELKQDKQTYPQNFNEFVQRIQSAGLGDVVILPTLGRWDLTFWDHFVYSARWSEELEKEIQTVLFSEDEMEYGDFCRKYRCDEGAQEKLDEWVRRKCDVLTLWSHIWYNGDIFVTRDDNFFKQTKKPKLIELGAGKILRPTEAVKMLDC